MAKTSSIIDSPLDWQSFHPAPVVGVDEVGRGCLAGPVYAAAACLRSSLHLEHLTDSKLLSETRREVLAPLIEQAHWVAVGFATVEEIESINILQASLLAMKRAVLALEEKMQLKAGHLLIDGSFPIPVTKAESQAWRQTTVVKGDLRCAPISAASIVAKVTRDKVMRELAGVFPQYGFEKHKGYASPVHKKAISEFGPTEVHRKTFAGVKEFVTGTGMRRASGGVFCP